MSPHHIAEFFVHNHHEMKGSADMRTNNSGRSWKRRLIAAVGVIGISMAGLVGFTSTANAAASTVPPWESGAPSDGSLTLHKLAGSAVDEQHDGSELDAEALPEGAKPLQGVTFSATPVKAKGTGESALTFELKTAEGWTNMDKAGVLEDIDAIVDEDGYTLGDSVEETTDAQGAASFASLPLGLYLIQETDAGGNKTVSPIEPFLVTIPLNQQNAAGNATRNWLYDVHAYPKNTVPENPTKSVSNPEGNLGGTVTWTVTQPIPTMNDNDEITSFSITDTLDSRLAYVADSTTVAIGSTALAAADYELTQPTGSSKELKVVFTASGLAKLMTSGGSNVVLTFKTTVTEAGIIENEAITNINDSEFTTGKPNTQWGGITVIKQDGDTELKLKGATFEIYDNSDLEGEPLDTKTTGDDGKASFGPLWVSNNGTSASLLLLDCGN